MTGLRAFIFCAAAAYSLGAPATVALAKTDHASTHQIVPIYQGVAPGTEGWTQKEVSIDLEDKRFNPLNPDTLVVNVTTPTLTVIRPAPGKTNGTAVIIAPGGGFRVLSFKNEGLRVAQWLADRGVTAFVLKYRLNPMPATAEEIMQGMEQMMRAAAARPAAADKPNFVGIIYSFAPDRPTAGLPPAFMAGAADDQLVTQMPQMFSNWLASGAKAELHIYAKGQHGFGTAKQNLPVDEWLSVFHAWLGQQGFVPSSYAH